MEQNKFVLSLVLALIVLGLTLNVAAHELRAGLDASGNLTQHMSINLIGGEVTVEPTKLGTSYHYDIKAQPILKVIGEGEEDVITIIRFKEQYVRAELSNGQDTFRAEAGVTAQPILTGTLQTVIAPIVDLERYSNYPFRQYVPAIVRGDRDAALLVNTLIKRRRDLDQVDITDVFAECWAQFSMECDTDKQYTSFLRECREGEKREICEQRVKMCGGEVIVRVNEEPDCNNRLVRAEIDYRSDREFDVTEVVYLSFWKDNECTRQTNDFNELLFCEDSRLGGQDGDFTIKAGILTI